MNRRTFIRAAGAAVASSQLHAQTQPGSRPMNVLLLMSDQHQHRTLGINRHPFARTPNLDALAASGVRFDSAYCTDPVCVPARASLLTGLYVHHHGVLNNNMPIPFRQKTIAHAFGAAGYMTGLIGKMHFVDAQTHGFDYRLDFNDWLQFLGPKAKLYADELGHPDSGSGLPQIPALWEQRGDPWSNLREKDGREGVSHPGRVSKIDESDQFDTFVANESVRFLEEHGNEHGKEQPFFLISSFLKPHLPFMPAERFARMFNPADMRLPATLGKVDLNSIPAQVRREIEHYSNTPELQRPDLARQHMAMYYASLAQMDDCAGKVLNALRETGLDKNTIVIYTSDHGEMLGEHGLWAKFQFYEPSVGVPLIFRVPGLTTAHQVSTSPTSITQVLPTLAELCRLHVNGAVDGSSLVADLRQPGTLRDRTIYSEHALGGRNAKSMIRRGDYKYCHYQNDTPELYNLREDPAELRNLVSSAQHHARAEEMKAALVAWSKT